QEDEFLDYFELEKSNQTSLPDIVSGWKKELNNVDLQEVYSEASYVEAVNNFLENSTIKEVNGGASRDLSSIPTIERIANIHLKMMNSWIILRWISPIKLLYRI